MKAPFIDRLNISEMSDQDIISELFRRIKMLRRSWCYSQEEFAAKTGVSRETIKRIENDSMKNISLATLLKILRATGMLGNVADLIEEVPESLFINGQKHINSSMRHV